MKKNFVQQVVLHTAQGYDAAVFSKQLSNFYFELVQRSFEVSHLTLSEKIAVIDQLLDQAENRETGLS